MQRFLPPLRKAALLIAAGGLAATGFQPLMLWPLTLAALALLIQRIAIAPGPGKAALAGWLFGVGLFSIGDNWIATAFTYQAQMPAWLGWIAVVLLSLYLAVYPMLAALAAWLLHHRLRAALAPAFAACWIITEWMRGWVFTGFAWNPLGMVTLGGFDRPGLARIAPWMGTYALSGLVVMLAGCWLTAFNAFRDGRRPAAAGLAILPAALLMLPLHGGSAQGTLPFTLVQPDFRQEALNDPAQFEAQFRKIAALSLPTKPGQRRLVLWPESGVPDYLRPGYEPYWYQDTYAGDPDMARERLGHTVGAGSLLMTGTTDLQIRRRKVTGAWNVITALDSTGAIRGSYAKAHLVPYGEYLPMRQWLEPIGLSRLVAGSLDFLPGPGAQTVDFGPVSKGGWGKAGFQICYEIIFSGEVVDRAHRPDYIFNPSNDGWFGSWGPPQHLAQARMRAIEEGLPVLRSTTTGISAVVDADGVVRDHIGRLQPGRIDGLVPPAHAPTLFARMGNILGLGWGVVLLLLALVARARRKR
ncbi:apolipoprotein N-acyltransferase [Novosphingobium cyanobacteriorum]|uniref:Apolipoprotein N-acyltransferase n=1 Tax=Novosphingobium cyanobacteriorum TaxID=3024215 RepID=A0ABT6CGL6_9SPHN|nr:apolipoprotein N-acyltransferase [Novosphingobium cyanobacteriorum]MDF8333074.1 apolipoprotein N-acyltransferase [Novosphingobium cyanobacteriorum]